MTHTLVQTDKLQKRLALTLSFSCLLLLALYIYFLSSSVTHVVMRTETVRATADLRSEVSVLESQYITAQHQVSATIASLEGYTKIDDKVFIDRSTPSLVLNTQ